jgi:hypothetical protein
VQVSKAKAMNWNPMTWGPDTWNIVAALGQAAGAVFTAIAAACAAYAVWVTKRIAETAIEAELLKEYAAPEMNKALRCFSAFDRQNKQQVERIRDHYFNHRSPNVSNPATMADFVWAHEQLDSDVNLSDARRHIHHYFKRIWSAYNINGISKKHLPTLTTAQWGYELWHDAVLPMTFADAVVQRARTNNPLLKAESWPIELIEWVGPKPPATSVDLL